MKVSPDWNAIILGCAVHLQIGCSVICEGLGSVLHYCIQFVEHLRNCRSNDLLAWHR